MLGPNAERGPLGKGRALEIALLDGSDNAIVGTRAHIPQPRRPGGCPCGCTTRLPWLDDPDCARHRRGRPERELAAWQQAVEHLQERGLPAAVPALAAARLHRGGVHPDWETAA